MSSTREQWFDITVAAGGPEFMSASNTGSALGTSFAQAVPRPPLRLAFLGLEQAQNSRLKSYPSKTLIREPIMRAQGHFPQARIAN